MNDCFKPHMRLLLAILALCFCGHANADFIQIQMNVHTSSEDQNGGTDYQTGDGVEFRFSLEDQGSSGTGLIDPFLNIQGPNNSNEQGFNHDGGSQLLNETVSQTDSLTIASVPQFEFDGNTWREFLLDLNEPNGGGTNLISLNQLQIFAATDTYATGDLSGEFSISEIGTTGIDEISFMGTNLEVVEIFQLSDLITQYEVLMDETLGAGGGSGTFNMRFFFDADILAGLNFTHLIVYSQFGTPPGSAASNSGFEEWSVGEVPEPSTWAMLLITACGALFVQYRRQRKLKLAAAETADC